MKIACDVELFARQAGTTGKGNFAVQKEDEKGHDSAGEGKVSEMH